MERPIRKFLLNANHVPALQKVFTTTTEPVHAAGKNAKSSNLIAAVLTTVGLSAFGVAGVTLMIPKN